MRAHALDICTHTQGVCTHTTGMHMHTLCMCMHTRALESKSGFSLFSFVSSTCLVSVLSCFPCFEFCFRVFIRFWFLLVIIS